MGPSKRFRYSHITKGDAAWKGWSSCWLRVGSVLARRATDEQISAPCSPAAARIGVEVTHEKLTAGR